MLKNLVPQIRRFSSNVVHSINLLTYLLTYTEQSCDLFGARFWYQILVV